jgi:hypothetical protein
MPSALAAALLAAALAGPGTVRRGPPAAVPTPALPDAEARGRALDYLRTIDSPIAAEQWQALGPAGAAALEEVARSGTALPTRRALALEGLSAIGGPSAEAAVLDLARSEGEPFAVRSAAVRGAARLLPEGRLLAALRPLLAGAAPAQLKGAVAEALARRAPGSACALVRAEAGKASPGDRAHFGRALRACER